MCMAISDIPFVSITIRLEKQPNTCCSLCLIRLSVNGDLLARYCADATFAKSAGRLFRLHCVLPCGGLGTAVLELNNVMNE